MTPHDAATMPPDDLPTLTATPHGDPHEPTPRLGGRTAWALLVVLVATAVAGAVVVAREVAASDPDTEVLTPDEVPDDGFGTVVTDGGLLASRSDSVAAGCDRLAVVDALLRDDVALRAHAEALAVTPDDVPALVAGFSSYVLFRDASVQRYGRDESGTLTETVVLGRGTMVLVDDAGQPRVRCADLTPLGPIPADETVEGPPPIDLSEVRQYLAQQTTTTRPRVNNGGGVAPAPPPTPTTTTDPNAAPTTATSSPPPSLTPRTTDATTTTTTDPDTSTTTIDPNAPTTTTTTDPDTTTTTSA